MENKDALYLLMVSTDELSIEQSKELIVYLTDMPHDLAYICMLSTFFRKIANIPCTGTERGNLIQSKECTKLIDQASPILEKYGE